MKILIVNQFASKPGDIGLDRHYVIAKKLQEFGDEVRVVNADRNYLNGEKYKNHNNSEVIFKTLKSNFRNIGTLERMFCYIEFSLKLFFQKKFNADVIISSTPNILACFFAYIKSRLSNKKFIFEVRDIWSESVLSLTNIGRYNPAFLISRSIEKYLLEHSDLIIYTMPNFKEFYKDLLGKDSSNNVYYCPQLIEDEYLQHQADKSSKEIDLVYSGTTKDKDNLFTIVQAFKILQEKHKEIKASLTVIGVLKNETIQEYSQKHKLNIKFDRNYYCRGDLIKKLSKYSAGIISLKEAKVYKYGISLNKAIDYMSAGIPLIVSGIKFGTYAGIYNEKNSPEDLCISFVELASLSEGQIRDIVMINKENIKQKNSSVLEVKKLREKIKLLLNFRH